MPSFNGELIFGLSPTIVTGVKELKTQENEFFGVNGTESLGGGFSRRRTMASGIHVCSDLAELAGIQALFDSYNDNYAYVLVDTAGRVWYNVMLKSFMPLEKYYIDDRGRFIQKFSAEFMHLSL